MEDQYENIAQSSVIIDGIIFILWPQQQSECCVEQQLFNWTDGHDGSDECKFDDECEKSAEKLLHKLFFTATLYYVAMFDLYVAKILKPTVRGFFCNDESIRYPAKPSTVPSAMLNVVGISLPIVVIILMECRKSRLASPYKMGKYKIPACMWNIYKMLACYGTGALFNQTLTDIGKKVIGRLRPNFMDICRPDLERLCSNINNYSYIEDYACSRDDVDHNISRVSFPSGHSSFSFYVAVFLTLYLQKKLKTKSRLGKPIIQFALIALAWFVALSRVMNNKHHWSDVLAGILLGSTVAIINTIFVHRIFDREESHPTDNLPNVLKTSNASGSTATEAHAQL